MSTHRQVGTEDLKAEVLQSMAADTRHAVISKPHSAAATMNIAPEAIPFEAADKTVLCQTLMEQFGLRYKPPRNVPAEVKNLSVDALMGASRANNDWIEFSGGRLQIPGSERVTSISSVRFGQQNLNAMVSGVTSEAVYLCKQLCLSMWASAGATRRWDELEDFVERQSYITSTIVDLGVPLKALLSPDMQAFLAQDVAGDTGVAQHMGQVGSDGNKLVAVPHCQRIELRVALYDEISGEGEDCAIELLIHTRGDANRSRLKVSSELESAHHNEMVARLAALARHNRTDI